MLPFVVLLVVLLAGFAKKGLISTLVTLTVFPWVRESERPNTAAADGPGGTNCGGGPSTA